MYNRNKFEIVPINLATIEFLDYYTQIALDAIWKELVQECVQNDIETGKTVEDDFGEDWDVVSHTPFTEPLWGVVVNR